MLGIVSKKVCIINIQTELNFRKLTNIIQQGNASNPMHISLTDIDIICNLKLLLETFVLKMAKSTMDVPVISHKLRVKAMPCTYEKGTISSWVLFMLTFRERLEGNVWYLRVFHFDSLILFHGLKIESHQRFTYFARVSYLNTYYVWFVSFRFVHDKPLTNRNSNDPLDNLQLWGSFWFHPESPSPDMRRWLSSMNNSELSKISIFRECFGA